jgi:hypothetical protein
MDSKEAEAFLIEGQCKEVQLQACHNAFFERHEDIKRQHELAELLEGIRHKI